MAENSAEKKHSFERWVASLKLGGRALDGSTPPPAPASGSAPASSSGPASGGAPVPASVQTAPPTLDEQATLVKRIPKDVIQTLRARESVRSAAPRVDDDSTAVFRPPPELLARAKRFEPPPKPGRPEERASAAPSIDSRPSSASHVSATSSAPPAAAAHPTPVVQAALDMPSVDIGSLPPIPETIDEEVTHLIRSPAYEHGPASEHSAVRVAAGSPASVRSESDAPAADSLAPGSPASESGSEGRGSPSPHPAPPVELASEQESNAALVMAWVLALAVIGGASALAYFR